MRKTLSVIIPAYNEEESLRKFLPEFVSFCTERGYQLIVVNDGSSDGTGELLREFSGKAQLTAIHHKVNRGYGGAIKSGIRKSKTDLVVTIDADGQHTLTDIDRMMELYHASDADMIVGSRKGQPAASSYRSAGKAIIRGIARMLMKISVYDLNSGIKLYDARLAKSYIRLCPDSMAYSDVIALVFISQKHRVQEIPVTINQRQGGKSTISTRTAFQTIMEIVHIVMLFNPLRVFLPLSILCILIGLGWGLPFLLRGNGVSVGALLAFITGGLLFMLGLLAEQLSLIRKNQVYENNLEE